MRNFRLFPLIVAVSLLGSACDSPTEPRLPEWVLEFSSGPITDENHVPAHLAEVSSSRGRLVVEGKVRLPTECFSQLRPSVQKAESVIVLRIEASRTSGGTRICADVEKGMPYTATLGEFPRGTYRLSVIHQVQGRAEESVLVEDVRVE